MAGSVTDEQKMVLDLYRMYLDDLGRIGARHETLRTFYLSVISALFVFLSLAGPTGALLTIQAGVRGLAGGVGALISLSWLLHMWSFAGLYKAKRHTLTEAEKHLPFKPFTVEKAELDNMARPRLTTVDRIVAIIFGMLFIVLIRL